MVTLMPLDNAKRRTQLRRSLRRDAVALPFLLPWLIGLVLFFGYPMIATVYFSFTHYDQISAPEWVGLSNWRFVFTQYRPFLQALGNTLWLIALMVPARVLFGMVTGILVQQFKRGAGVYRTAFFLPYLAPPVAATIVFVFVLNPNGPVNHLLARISITGPNWFNDPSTSKLALTLLAMWGIGDLMIIFLASLLDVPREQYEAASLDGAGSLQQFRYVTLPAIKPIILFAAVTGVIQATQYYTQALVAGKVASGSALGSGVGFDPGYPQGSTLTLAQLVYSLGFQHFNTGAASVVAVVLMGLSLVFAAILLRRGSAFLGAGE